MQSLQRLIKIGIYYPSGHSVLDKATKRFRHSLIKVAGNKSFVRFNLKNDALHLQDIALDDSQFFVTEFKETLHLLSIKHLDIDREISSTETHTFIRSLLACKAKFTSTKQFVRINLEDLPASVRISQTEYLTTELQPVEVDDSSDDQQTTFDVFFESLDRQGLTQEQLELCKQLLETASANSLIQKKDTTLSPKVSWNDVERLILSLVKADGSSETTEKTYYKRDLNALASILTTLEQSTKNKKSLEAIKLLVTLIKKNSQETDNVKDKPKEKKRKDQEESDLESVADIENFIKGNQVHAIHLGPLFDADRSEILTIVMQLLVYKHSLHVQVRIQQILRDILTTKLTDAEWQIIAHGIHQLFEKTDSDHLPITLMMILDPLRRSQHASSLLLFEKISHNCNTFELKKFLPHLLNEILIIGSQDDPRTFNELCDVALFLSASDIKEAIAELKKLDAFVESKVAPNLFFSMSVSNYSLFSPLLHTSMGELLGKRIIQAFVNKPPGWIIEALLPLLDSGQILHRKFLYEFLNSTRFSEPTSTMKTLAGQIISQSLPEMSEEKRKDLNLIKTIKAISQLRGYNLRKVLKIIAYKKRFLIIPVWPAHCRTAARETLSGFEKRKKFIR